MKDANKKKQQLLDELEAARRVNIELQAKVDVLQSLLAERMRAKEVPAPPPVGDCQWTPEQLQQLVDELGSLRAQLETTQGELKETRQAMTDFAPISPAREIHQTPKQAAPAETAPARGDVPKIGAILIELGFLDQERLDRAIAMQKQQKPHRPLGQILVARRFITRAQLETATMQQLDLLKARLQGR
jgi:hypothetical protein